MTKVKVLALSVNPNYYDVKELAKASYDDAKKFIEKDSFCAFSYREFDLDLSKVADYSFHPDGALDGDTSDSLLMWIRVCED